MIFFLFLLTYLDRFYINLLNFQVNGSVQKSRWQHTSEINNKTKSIIDVVEDERDPDVIPSQYCK